MQIRVWKRNCIATGVRCITIFCLTGVLWTLMTWLAPCAGQLHAMTAYWGRHPDKDRLVFRFDTQVPDYSLERVGPREVLLSLPADIWERETADLVGLNTADALLLRGLEQEGNLLRIRLASETFRIEDFTLDAPARLVVDFFRDPQGVAWKPPPTVADADSDTRSEDLEALPGPANDTASRAPVVDESSSSGEQLPSAGPEPVHPEQDSGPAHSLRFPVERGGPTEPLPVPDTRSDNGADGGQPSTSEPEDLPVETVVPEQPPTPNHNATREGADHGALLDKARASLNKGRAAAARQQLTELARDENLPEALRPEVLFALARASYAHYGGAVEDHFEELIDALETAVNAAPESPRVPWALLHLGLVHLKAGNVPEATGYFNLLQERFPEHPLIPSSWVLYGQTYLEAGAFQAAADHFQHVVTVYPEHEQALPAGVGLATALKELGFFDQALAMIRFVEDNWPEHYLSSPGFLRLAGFVAQQLGDFDMARDRYWTNFNLEPGAEGADVILTRLGDIFLMMEQKEAAREVYEKAAQDFPDLEGGLVARIRLAEEGINDQPTVQGMFSIFDRSFTLRPRQVYADIIKNHPDSPVAPMAQVKLGIWYVFNNKPRQALELVETFLRDHPSSILTPRMLEVGRMAYRQYALAQVEEGNYERVLEVWNSCAYLKESLDALDPQAILSTALCNWKTGEVSRAKDLAMPFLTGERRFVPDSESALDLMLAIYIEGHAWEKVLDLGEAMSGRDMSQERQAQLTYARALAHENLGQKEKSRPLWEDLANDPNLSVKQKGFAYYFLAREAMRQQDLQSAQLLAQNGLSFLIQSSGDRAKALDLLDLLISVSERSGRKLDALSWGMDLEKQLSPEDELWPAFRYRLAGLYRNSGDTQKWIDILKSLESNHPDVMYGRMAASDLRNHELGQRAAQYY